MFRIDDEAPVTRPRIVVNDRVAVRNRNSSEWWVGKCVAVARCADLVHYTVRPEQGGSEYILKGEDDIAPIDKHGDEIRR